MNKHILSIVFLLCVGLVVAEGSYSGNIDLEKLENGSVEVSVELLNCGDGIMQSYLSEDCDGSDFGGASCESIFGPGYSGSLSCSSNCEVDTSGCFLVSVFTSSGGGGGSSSNRDDSEECESDWKCSGWSECKDRRMTRLCIDANECEEELNKPAEVAICSVEEASEGEGDPVTYDIQGENPNDPNTLFTGSAIGDADKGSITIGIILLLVALGLLFVTAMKVKKKKFRG